MMLSAYRQDQLIFVADMWQNAIYTIVSQFERTRFRLDHEAQDANLRLDVTSYVQGRVHTHT